MTKWFVGLGVVVLGAAMCWIVVNDDSLARAASETAAKEQLADAATENSDFGDTVNRRLVVPVARAERVQSVTQMREYTGSVVARRHSSLAFERGGRIIQVLVDDGEEVAKGQLLAKLDVEIAVVQRDAAKASLEQAQAVCDELKAGPRKETIDAAQSRVASLAAIADRLQADYRRSKRLSASDAVSREQLETTQFEWQAAKSTLDQAEAQLAELLAGTRAEKLRAQQAVIAGLEAELRKLELDVEDGDLLAPFRGRVANRVLDEGNVVTPGAVVLELVEDSALEARIGVPVNSSGQLVVGDKYTVSAFNSSVQAELVSLLPMLDGLTRTRTAVLDLPDSSSSELQMVPGQIVRLQVHESVKCEGIRLPSTALVPGPRGMWNVYVVRLAATDKVVSKVERRTVELLYTLQDSVVVTGTVRDGEVIVVDGTHRVVEGQAVDIRFAAEGDRGK